MGEDDTPPGGNTGGGGEGRIKYVIDDVNVRVAVERSQYLDADGKLITEDYRVLLKDDIKKSAASRIRHHDRLPAPLEQCRAQAGRTGRTGRARRTARNIAASRRQRQRAGCVRSGRPRRLRPKPLTRRERANNVKKRDVFGKYGEQARAVLEALLDKFADHGVQDIEDAKVLELPPFDQFGSKTQIRRGIFGSVEQYTQAVHELEQALYDLFEQKQA
jgi:type I restriction enzyme R subunit